MPITSERLTEIEARANAATPGPWDKGYIYDQLKHGPNDDFGDYCENIACRPIGNMVNGSGDAAFIAAARADIPALIAEVVRSWSEIDRLRALNHEIGKLVPPTEMPF
jgi:hypothetical protein